MYKRSLKLGKRDISVVYYDLTNYFFEWEEEGGLVQYGHSKEGRPLPIVQMGLFVDREGFPLAMCIEPGNKAETTTLKLMEEILKEKFGLSKVIVCTDAGLSSYENRKNDAVGWTSGGVVARDFVNGRDLLAQRYNGRDSTAGAYRTEVHPITTAYILHIRKNPEATNRHYSGL